MTKTTELTTKHRATRLVRVGIAVGAACLIGGTAYAENTAVNATASDTVVRTASNKDVAPPDGDNRTEILTVALPAGQYVLSAYGDLVNFGPSDFTRCQVVVNGAEIASVSTIVGDQGLRNRGPAGYVSPFSLAGGVKVGNAGATATLQCWHDSPNGAGPYVDGGATLMAHRTESLKMATQ
jgi:hypothetical protein